MRAIVEFGVRGGHHTSHVCQSTRQAANLAASLAFVFGMRQHSEATFKVTRSNPRVSLTSDTHFVAVSVLDGVERGPWYTNTRYAQDRNR